MAQIAVIQTGGKQYIVKAGDVLKVERLEAEDGQEMTFDPLLVADEGKETAQVGTPIVEGIKVTATVLGEGRDRKVEVVKYKPKTRYHKKNGHRQQYTSIRIDSIK